MRVKGKGKEKEKKKREKRPVVCPAPFGIYPENVKYVQSEKAAFLYV
jgi:hypothetical protein